ncbi:response regulator, partial [Bacillus paranthracis]|nr:response regulator [Bacillus paranthracis]
MKILVIEDEIKTGDYLCQGLREAGFSTDLVRNGKDGLHQALNEYQDLLILDVMLPGLSGWQVLQQLRQQGIDRPI